MYWKAITSISAATAFAAVLGVTAPTRAGDTSESKPSEQAATPATQSKPAPLPQDEAFEIIKKVRDAGEALKDYTLVMVKQERFGKKMAEKETLRIKWARPYKLYLKNIKEPYKGREAIFVKGRDKEFIAHRGSFPDITVHLDPHGSMAMKNNHHPVDEASLLNFARLLWKNVSLARKRHEGSIKLLRLIRRNLRTTLLESEKLGRKI